MEGVGTRAEAQLSRIIGSNIYIHYPYASSKNNPLIDIWKLRMDAKNMSGPQDPSIRDRHDALVAIIKKHLDDPNYKYVVLTGISHGALIMYKAILQVMFDLKFDEYNSKMDKICFYPISCPVPLPTHFLKGDAYCSVYGYNDPLYTVDILAKLAKVFGARASNLFKDACLQQEWTKAATPLYNIYDTQRNIMFANDPSDARFDRLACNKMPQLDDNDRNEMCAQLDAYTKDRHANQFFAHGVMPYSANFYLYMPPGVQGGGVRTTIKVLGRDRLVITKGKKQYVKYKGELIPLRKAHVLQKIGTFPEKMKTHKGSGKRNDTIMTTIVPSKYKVGTILFLNQEEFYKIIKINAKSVTAQKITTFKQRISHEPHVWVDKFTWSDEPSERWCPSSNEFTLKPAILKYDDGFSYRNKPMKRVSSKADHVNVKNTDRNWP